MQNISFTPDKELNVFICWTPSYLIIYRSCTLLKMVRFYWPTLYILKLSRWSYTTACEAGAWFILTE